MDEQRKETIIREIKYWKQSKLLPDTYCDFLLTLYTEGNAPSIKQLKPKSLSGIKGLFSFILVQMLLIITIVVIYFTDYSLGMQIAFVLFASAFSGYIGIRTYKLDESFAKFYFLIASIKLFLIAFHTLRELLEHSRTPLLILLLVTCIVWFFVGYRWKSKYFYIAAALGGISFFAFMIFFY